MAMSRNEEDDGLEDEEDVGGQTLTHTPAMDEDDFFRTVHSRKLNTLNQTYLLPVDHDEVQVFK